MCPRSDGCTTTESWSIRAPTSGWIFFDREHLFEDRPVVGVQHEPVGRVHRQLQASVAGHRLGDVDQQGVRHRVAAVPQQRVDHLLGVVAGGPRVPEPERGDAVGVDVLRCAFELGERRDRVPALVGERMVDLQQQRLVALDDQRTVGHAGSLEA